MLFYGHSKQTHILKKMALTIYKIDSLKPKEKLYQVADGEGLVLDILPTGKKVWRYRYRITGQQKQEKITLGAYPKIGLSDARLQKAEFQKLIQQGISPAKQKQQQKTAAIESDTVADFSKVWLDKIIFPKVKNAKDTVAILNNDILPVLGHRKIQDIITADIFLIIDTIQERNADTQALLAHSILLRLFDYAMQRGKIALNPAKVIKASSIAKVNHRDKVLSRTEIAHFIKAVYSSDMVQSNKLGLHLLIICMVRKCELTEAKWTEFDFNLGLWTIPAERMKKSKEHTVYLSRQAVNLFKELKQLSGYSDFVFPSPRGKNQPIAKNLLNVAVYKLKLPFQFVLHDFRRTASSNLHEAGFNTDAIEKALAHTQSGVRGIYNKAEYAQQRKELLQYGLILSKV